MSGPSWRYAYDNRNRLYNVQQWDTSTSVKLQEVQYDYDAEDRRIAKRVYQSGTLTSTEQYGLDGQNALLTTDASLNVVGRYLFGPGADQVLGQEVAGHGSNGFQWLISDQEGSVRRVVDASGSVSKSIVYDAFGQRISTSGPGALPRYQYTGQQFDEEDKLGYFDARYYDPSQGRFVNQDPAEDGNNWYDYAGDDPVNNSDPSGLSVLGNNAGSGNSGGFGSAVGDAVSWLAGGGISNALSSFRHEAISDTAVTSAYRNWSTIDPAVQQQSFDGDPRIYAAHQLGSALAANGYATEGSQIVNDAWLNSPAAVVQRQANIASYSSWALTNTGLLGALKSNFQTQGALIVGAGEGVGDFFSKLHDIKEGLSSALEEGVVDTGYAVGAVSDQTMQENSGAYSFAVNHFQSGGTFGDIASSYGNAVVGGLRSGLHSWVDDVTSGNLDRMGHAASSLSVNAFALALNPARSMSSNVVVRVEEGLGSNGGNIRVGLQRAASAAIHGNSAASPRVAALYALFQKNGNFLKWGITQNLAKRYTKAFLLDKDIVKQMSGVRADMLQAERDLVETQPGPLNREPWAGKRSGK